MKVRLNVMASGGELSTSKYSSNQGRCRGKYGVLSDSRQPSFVDAFITQVGGLQKQASE